VCLIGAQVRHRTAHRLIPYGFVAPALGVFGLFALGPILFAVVLALFHWDPVGGTTRFVGLGNFSQILTDPRTHSALRNNILWIVLSLGIQLPIALLLAATLSDASRSSRLLRTLFFSPLVIPAVAIGLLFGIILDGHFGSLNAALGLLKGEAVRIGWLSDPRLALIALLGVACWQYTGFHMMVLLAGIQSIPHELYEAAALDGAGWCARLTRITLPLLRQVLLVDALLIAIGSMKVFDLVWVMTRGGPNNATDVLATHMYSTAIMSEQMGAGSAIALLMLAITLGFAIIHARLAARGGGD